jgi:hypothetical protein
MGYQSIAVNPVSRARHGTRNENRPDEHAVGGKMRKLTPQPLEEVLGGFSGRFVHDRHPIPVGNVRESALRPSCARF